MRTFKTKLTAEVKAHTGVTICRSEDEERLEQHSCEVAQQLEYDCYIWSTAAGLRCATDPSQSDPSLQDLGEFMAVVSNWTKGPAVLVAHDLISTINKNQQLGIHLARMFRTIGQLQRALNEDAINVDQQNQQMRLATEKVKEAHQAFEEAYSSGDQDAFREASLQLNNFSTGLAQQYQIPAEKRVLQLVLCDQEDSDRSFGADSIQMEYPDRDERIAIVEQFVEQREAYCENVAAVAEAAAGLSEYQTRKALLLSFVASDELNVDEIAEYKKQALQTRGITWIDPDERGFDALGGLEPLKDWLRARAMTFTEEAAEYDVVPARGTIVAGMPGCGKSALVKALPTEWKRLAGGGQHSFPLLYADIGSTRSKWIGESEAFFRDLLATADAVAGTDGGGAILWIDEFERAMGSDENVALDSGVNDRTMQQFLTWAQEHKSRVFLYATSNNPHRLPSAAMRAGRFDALWWVDSPGKEERQSICSIYRDHYRRASGIDVNVVSVAAAGNTGAEIEKAFGEAAVAAMVDRKETIDTGDVVHQLKQLSKTTDTFQMPPELERWKKSAMKANPTTVDLTTTKTPVVVDLSSAGSGNN